MKKIILLITVVLYSATVFSQTFNGSVGPIPDGCGVVNEYPVTVSGIGILGSTFFLNNIKFDITHTFDSQLDIYLVAPNGTVVVISTGNGGSGDNYTNTTVSAVMTTDASGIIYHANAPFTGTYYPEGNLGVLNGSNANGVWKLRVCDHYPGTLGTLNNWSITFTPTPLPATNDECSSAIPLTVGPDQYCGVATNGTVYGATASPVSGNACAGSEDDDVWFSFVATATTHRISLTNVIGSIADLYHSLWTGTDCNSLSLVPGTCSDADVSNPTDLVIGQTYYVRVYTTVANPFQTTMFTICIGSIPSMPNYVSLTSPSSATISPGGSITVYGQFFKVGMTDVVTGQAPGLQVWVGISPMGSNTSPDTWTNWTLATFNQEVGVNDEYKATIGSLLEPGTYYFATRFQQTGGYYYYGGIDSGNNGNFWDGTTYLSGILTVNAPTAPFNDECTGATPLTVGNVFTDFAVTGSTYGAVDSASYVINCDGTSKTVNSGVYYSATVPASGALAIETNAAASNSLNDTVLVGFVGNCSSLVDMTCNDNFSGSFSRIMMFGQSPGSTIYIAVYKNGAIAPSFAAHQFQISAYYNASLGSDSFDSSRFSYYPNPIQDVLNLSYNQEISNVEVFNLLGQKMISKSIRANEAKIDFTNLPKGVYLVNVSSDNKMKTIKVVKE